MTQKQFQAWAMLAHNFNAASAEYPLIVQYKLNGVRAKWDKEHKCFISRSGKLIPRVCIPHLYDKMSLFPGASYDGELYCHGMALQDIKGILTQSRKETSPDAAKLDFNVFDVIQSDYATLRLKSNAYTSYEPHLAFQIVDSTDEVHYWLDCAIRDGFEGIILRTFHGLYVEGRSWNLLKLKPLHHAEVTILRCIEGNAGKFRASLGAFSVWLDLPGKERVFFNVGGGNISTVKRDEIWRERDKYPGRKLLIEYRELTKDGKPAQAQIKEIL